MLRLSKQNLFRRLEYTPHRGQLLVHRSTASRRIVACGVRWGKSTLGAMELVAALLEPCEQSLGWLVAPNFDVTDRIFLPAALALQRHFPLQIRLISQRERRIVVTNLGGGVSEMRAKSADTPTSLLGEALNWIIVDECARLRADIWDAHLSQRLIDRHGWALLISTPNGCNWFRTLFKRGLKGRDADFESWSSPSWDNPHIPRELIEAERARLSSEVFDQEYGGKFAGEDDEPCELCGGPTREIPGSMALDVDEPAPLCPECGREVDLDGRTIVGWRANGQHYPLVLRYKFDPGDEHLAEIIRRDFSTGGRTELARPA